MNDPAAPGPTLDPPPPYSTVHGIVISAGAVVQPLAFRRGFDD